MTLLRASLLALAVLGTAGAASAQTKIKIADSFPVGHYLPKYFTTPMMERLKANPAAKGLEFEYYPAEQMGKAKDFLSLTQSGLIDIAYVAPGFVSDKMPASVVSELPLPFQGSCQPTLAYFNLAKPGGLLDKKEFAPNGVRLIFTIVLPPYQVITRKPFATLKDIEGMKIRASGSAKELVLKKLKATPVLMPTPEVYESLSRGTIDGVLFPVVALGLPLLDTSLTISRRLLAGRPVMQADRDHVHHRLLGQGLPVRRAVLLLYGVCAVFAALSLGMVLGERGSGRWLLGGGGRVCAARRLLARLPARRVAGAVGGAAQAAADADAAARARRDGGGAAGRP